MDDYQDPEDIPPRPDPAQTVEDEPGSYDALDEASMESFPASDPVGTVASRDGKPKRMGVDERGDDSGPDASEAPEEEGSASPG